MLPPNSLLLAGVPATGKSSFGNWLEEQKGYLHFDFDEEDIIQRRGFGEGHWPSPKPHPSPKNQHEPPIQIFVVG
jgi:hypothetical protein